MKLTLTPDERVEYEALIRQAVGADSGDKIVRDVAHEILDLLHDAEQAGRTWAARVVSDLTEIGARGLNRARPDERHLLAPVEALVAGGESLGQRLRQAAEGGLSGRDLLLSARY